MSPFPGISWNVFFPNLGLFPDFPGYIQKIKSGEEDFESLASQFSDCSSAKAGGDLGAFGRGEGFIPKKILKNPKSRDLSPKKNPKSERFSPKKPISWHLSPKKVTIPGHSSKKKKTHQNFRGFIPKNPNSGGLNPRNPKSRRFNTKNPNFRGFTQKKNQTQFQIPPPQIPDFFSGKSPQNPNFWGEFLGRTPCFFHPKCFFFPLYTPKLQLGSIHRHQFGNYPLLFQIAIFFFLGKAPKIPNF